MTHELKVALFVVVALAGVIVGLKAAANRLVRHLEEQGKDGL